jgi:hypothetical protein
VRVKNVEINIVLTCTMRVQYPDVNQRIRMDCVRDEGHYGDYPAGEKPEVIRQRSSPRVW